MSISKIQLALKKRLASPQTLCNLPVQAIWQCNLLSPSGVQVGQENKRSTWTNKRYLSTFYCLYPLKEIFRIYFFENNINVGQQKSCSYARTHKTTANHSNFLYWPWFQPQISNIRYLSWIRKWNSLYRKYSRLSRSLQQCTCSCWMVILLSFLKFSLEGKGKFCGGC